MVMFMLITAQLDAGVINLGATITLGATLDLGPVVATPSFILQSDGSSKLLQSDGSSFLLLS